MKISEIAPILYKLYEEGYGDVELYTHWEDEKTTYPNPEFHLHLEGIHFNEFKVLYPQNPFVRNCEVRCFHISPAMSFHDTECLEKGMGGARDAVLQTRKAYGKEN